MITNDDDLGSGRDLPAARSTARLLSDRAFGTYEASKLVSVVGLWAHNLVAALWAYQLTGSTVYVGLVSVAVFGPQLVFALWSGDAADRGDRRRQIIRGRLICATASGGLAAFVALADPGAGSATVALMVSSLVLGFGLMIGGPAMQAIVPSLVESSEVAKAVTIDSLPMLVGLSAGPVFGAFITHLAGPAAAFAVAAGGHLIFALVVGRLRVPDRDRSTLELDHGFRGGLRFVRHDRVAALMLLAMATAGYNSDPAITLTPALSQLLRGDDSLVGILASAFGVGAALGALALVHIRPLVSAAMTTFIGLVVMGVGAMAAAVSGSPLVSITALFVDGVGMAWVTSSATVILQLRTPELLRGRVMALWIVAFIGARPFAGVVNGSAAELVSTPAALALAATLALVVAVLCRPGRLAPPQDV